ncbi:sigma-70 family RNA polymerase sigma factor [Nocardia concava]|uniref:sigma-70 family RNA polymerase sigma factor n=1 Tax=Nocardia concava TaxID=257281 RepID=UPI000311A815|nr:sigma-70 family RNA polymerase sigma factor [Nocardia concava]
MSIDSEEFAVLFAPHRRELLVHCYRMLGSAHDAEDVVQETYLRAWRAIGDFEGRSKLRHWLYRIATNAALRELEKGHRRSLPSGLANPVTESTGDQPLERQDMPWLEPIPTALALSASEPDPAEVVAQRHSIRLAFVAALQYLPPRQRAVLLLRDVLEFRASEVAALLDISPAAANGLLQRARDKLAAVRPTELTVSDTLGPDQQHVLEEFMAAFERADIPGLQRMLLADATLEMPPLSTWFFGRTAIIGFWSSQILTEPGMYRVVATSANGQPAAAMYKRHDDGSHYAHALHVLTPASEGIARIVVFLQPAIFELFDLPMAFETVDREGTAHHMAP